MIIHPYKWGSRSAKGLRASLNGLKNRAAWILRRPPNSPSALIINWGGQRLLYPMGRRAMINPPELCQHMSDKLLFFRRTNHDRNCLEWSSDRSEASEWGVKGKVFVRLLTRASAGRGINVWSAAGGTVIPYAPLYTRHQKKTAEYRVHLARKYPPGPFSPILVQRKVFLPKHDKDAPRNWDVRSHENGFTFQTYHDGLQKVPKTVLEVAQNIMGKYFPELHFAALDVLYHAPSDTAIVCEGNTAPGLEGHSLEIYARYLLDLEKDYRRFS